MNQAITGARYFALINGVLLLAAVASAQEVPSILQVEVENYVSYVGDTTDPSRVARSAGVVAASRNMPPSATTMTRCSRHTMRLSRTLLPAIWRTLETTVSHFRCSGEVPVQARLLRYCDDCQSYAGNLSSLAVSLIRSAQQWSAVCKQHN